MTLHWWEEGGERPLLQCYILHNLEESDSEYVKSEDYLNQFILLIFSF